MEYNVRHIQFIYNMLKLLQTKQIHIIKNVHYKIEMIAQL